VTEKPRWLRVRDFQLDSPVFTWLIRIWVTGRPVFLAEGHVPKHRIGQRELHSCLWVLALTSGYMGKNNTLPVLLLSWTFDRVSRCPLYTCVDMRINAP